MAAEAGQLELNVMMPVITHNIVFALIIVGNASRVFAERCVDGIEADEAQCAYWLERSPALVTALAPKIGYAEAAKLAKEAVATGLTVKQLVEKKKLLPPEELEEVLDLRAMTELGRAGREGNSRRRVSHGRVLRRRLSRPARRSGGSDGGPTIRLHPRRSWPPVRPRPSCRPLGPGATASSTTLNGSPSASRSAAAAPGTRCRPARRPPCCPSGRAVVRVAVEHDVHG